jgi:pyruvate dehydrogenase E1 component alpha subunit
LPVVFVCENNVYGEYSRIDLTTPIEHLADRAASYGMPAEIVDGQLVGVVEDAMRRAIERARQGDGPTLIECKTYRYSGHSRADAATYRPAGELDAWLARDPIVLHQQLLIREGTIGEADVAHIESRVRARIEECIEQTMATEPAGVAAMFSNVIARQ